MPLSRMILLMSVALVLSAASAAFLAYASYDQVLVTVLLLCAVLAVWLLRRR